MENRRDPYHVQETHAHGAAYQEYEADELGKYMSSAHRAGCQGPAPENQHKNQLMTVP